MLWEWIQSESYFHGGLLALSSAAYGSGHTWDFLHAAVVETILLSPQKRLCEPGPPRCGASWTSALVQRGDSYQGSSLGCRAGFCHDWREEQELCPGEPNGGGGGSKTSLAFQ